MTDSAPSKETVLQDLVTIVTDMTSDWDLDFGGKIDHSTRLMGDLAFESIDVVQFIVAIEEKYQRRDLPFESLLMTGGRYVDDLTLDKVADFLVAQTSNAPAADA
ncbi:MAG: acyl carrier protein [Planctomycetota bacterium]